MKKIFAGIILISSILLVATELDLESSWQILLQNNPQIKSEQLNIVDQETNVKLALSDLLPSGSLSASYQRGGDELSEDNMGYNLSLSQSLFQGGKLLINYQNSKKTLDQAKKSYQSLLLDLRLQLETKYYSVLEKKESFNLANDELEYSQNNLSVAEIKYNNGNINYSELLQLRSMNAQQEVAVLKANNNLQIAVSDLAGFLLQDRYLIVKNISISKYDGSIDKLACWQISDLNDIETDLINYARDNNPEFQNSIIEVEISKSEVKSSKGSFLPSISMNLGKSWSYQYISDSPEGSLSFGINASVPLFSIYDNYLNYTNAKNSLKKTELNNEQSGIDLELEIKSGLLNLVASALELRAAETALEYSSISYETAQEQFNNNMITANELLNTQITLRTAENSLNTAKYTFLNNKCELQKGLGILEEPDLWEILFN